VFGDANQVRRGIHGKLSEVSIGAEKPPLGISAGKA
jgi:hypothetical protein